MIIAPACVELLEKAQFQTIKMQSKMQTQKTMAVGTLEFVTGIDCDIAKGVGFANRNRTVERDKDVYTADLGVSGD